MSIFISFLFVHNGFSQSKEIELAKEKYEKEQNLYSKINLSNALSEAFTTVNLDSAFFYNKKAMFYSKKIKSNYGFALSQKVLSHLYSSDSLFDLSTETALKVIPVFKEKSSHLNLGYCYNKIGDNYQNLGNNKKAFEYYYLSESIYQKTDSISKDKLWNLTNIASLFISKSIYSEALERLRKAQKMASNSEKYYKQLSQTYMLMANIYEIYEDYEEAIEYYNESLKILEKNNDTINIARCKLNIVGTYVVWGKNDKALSLLDEIPEENENLDFLFLIYLNKSEIYLNKKEHDKAFVFNSKMLNLLKDSKDNYYEVMTKMQLSRIYTSLGNKLKAIELLEMCLEESKSLSGFTFRIEILSELSILNEEIGNYEKAYNQINEYITTNDSVLKVQRIKETEFLKTVFNEEKSNLTIDRKERELTYLKEKDILRSKYNKYLIVAFLILILFSAIIYNKQRKLILTQKKAESLELEKHEQQLKFNNQQILDLSLHVHDKNDLLTNIKTKLKDVLSQDKDHKKALSSIVNSINEDIRVNKEKIGLYKVVDESNVSFLQKLVQNYPNLSTKEQKIVQMLRSELSSKQIATQLSLSIYSIDTYRSKIRSKMKVPKNIKLSSFIRKL